MKKRDKQRARAIAQAQKQRQQEKAVSPLPPVSSDSERAAAVPQAGGQPTTGPLQPGSVAIEPLLLTVAQVCQLLSISRATLYRLEQAEKIPGRVRIGGQVRYHRETVEAWLRDQVQGRV